MNILHQPRIMNLADPELELIDPTPNVHSMFVNFDRTFFWGTLSSRCVVRWSKRMYSCAGTCSYERRGGLCDIALSEPLLKLRPRKDMVETLLHEMIHAYLFVTNRDQDRDGHGPNFHAHMHRINRAAGLNISIYHSFHDEVKLYQTHWWRCNGPCQFYKPYFGIVRRSHNRPPGPSDYWWERHKRMCGGTFIKIKEPDKPNNGKKEPSNLNKGKKTNVQPNADITKYINNNNQDVTNKNVMQNNNNNPVLKDSNNVPSNLKAGVKTNNINTLVMTNNNVIFSPQVPKITPIVYNGIGQILVRRQPNNIERNILRSVDVRETVRTVWSNTQIGSNNIKQASKESIIASNPSKHKPDFHTESPPPKIKKIDSYFKTAATSLLKDLYGQDIKITQSENDQKLKAISTHHNIVDCPVCNDKIKSDAINRHLDECLNKDIIKKLSEENVQEVKNKTGLVVKSTRSLIDHGPCGINTGNIAVSLIEKPHNTSSSFIPKVNDLVVNDPVIDLDEVECESDANSIKSRKPLNELETKHREQIIDVRGNNAIYKEYDDYSAPSTSQMIETKPIVTNPLVKIEPSCSYYDTKETALNDRDIKPRAQIIDARGNNAKLGNSDTYSAPFTSHMVQTNPSVANLPVKIEPSCSYSDTKKTALNERDIKPPKQIIDARDNNAKFIKSDGYSAPSTSHMIQSNPSVANLPVKIEPSCSYSDTKETTCPCCGDKLKTSVNEHLDECLSFFENNTTIPDEGIIVIDDDFNDEFDESDKFNKTGTKFPCPCCLTMIEEMDMNPHLAICLDN